MSVTVVSGIRELHPGSIPDVDLAVTEELARPDVVEMRFGGALGVDTAALASAAHAPRPVVLAVYVPWTLDRQPAAAQDVAEAAARYRGIRLHELRLPAGGSSYLRRNDAMLDGADRLLAFTDGRAEGGTAYTIRRAEAMGLEVEVVPVASQRARGRRVNPRVTRGADGLAFSAPVHALAAYVSRDDGPEWRRDAIYALKENRDPGPALARLAEELAAFVAATPALAQRPFLVPMPRRLPGHANDLLPLARALAALTGKSVEEDLLVRSAPPENGYFDRRRDRFPPEEHARSLRSYPPPGPVILLDNVLTTGGSMEGALRVLERAGADPVGLAVLHSVDAEIEA